jgi:hypothetical protein
MLRNWFFNMSPEIGDFKGCCQAPDALSRQLQVDLGNPPTVHVA